MSHSAETKEKIRQAHLGVRLSENHKRRISEAHKKRGTLPPSRKGMGFSPEQKEKIRKALKGRKHSPLTEEHKRKISKTMTGQRHPEWRNQNKGNRQRGANSHFWKGGTTEENQLIRASKKYQNWRTEVFERDQYRCRGCGDGRGRNLNAHHVIPFSKLLEEGRNNFPLFSIQVIADNYEPLWDVSNGITLCKDCHRENQYKPLDGQRWDQIPETIKRRRE